MGQETITHLSYLIPPALKTAKCFVQRGDDAELFLICYYGQKHSALVFSLSVHFYVGEIPRPVFHSCLLLLKCVEWNLLTQLFEKRKPCHVIIASLTQSWRARASLYHIETGLP